MSSNIEKKKVKLLFSKSTEVYQRFMEFLHHFLPNYQHFIAFLQFLLPFSIGYAFCYLQIHFLWILGFNAIMLLLSKYIQVHYLTTQKRPVKKLPKYEKPFYETTDYDSLHWINQIVKQIWPEVSEQLKSAIYLKMASLADEYKINIKTFDMGEDLPKFLGVKCITRGNKTILLVDVRLVKFMIKS